MIYSFDYILPPTSKKLIKDVSKTSVGIGKNIACGIYSLCRKIGCGSVGDLVGFDALHHSSQGLIVVVPLHSYSK